MKNHSIRGLAVSFSSRWRTRKAAVPLAVLLVVAALLVPAAVVMPVPGVSKISAASAATTEDPVIVVGGDIACPPGKTVDLTHCEQGKTGALLAAINPVAVVPLGDEQYDSGTPAEYAGSYNVTGWGSDKGISRPAAGNHEYRTTGATGYYGYFGSNAGDPQKGYYSWDVAGPNNAFTWHMIALNSECAVLGGGSITAGCGVGSSQEAWLKADLAAHPNVCTIAYWHRPRFSSSTTTPSSTTYNAFWNDLYAAGADVVLNGHAHDYERFAPQTSSGAADPNGLTEFVVGSGGVGFQTMGPGIPNSVVRNADVFGVLKMTLHQSSFDWQFMPASGYSLTDSGTTQCHSAGAADTTAPTAPASLSATASSASQVSLNWTAATDNVGVKSYNIYRGSNGATPQLITTTTTNATSFTDTTVTGSTPYTYQVSAQDAAGNIGPLSNTASVTTPTSTDTTPPTAPSALQAEQVFSNEIDLGWTGSTDSGTGVSGYKVYRQGPGESTFTLLATTTGTGAGHNSYVDTTVKPSSAYQYKVTAYDGANNESAASNTVPVSTPAGPSSKTFTFTTSGDATIQQASPTTNAGSSSQLIIDNSPVDDVMMKFNVATSGCDSLTSAKLTLTNNGDGSTKGGDFYTTGSNWTESGVNWGNAPTRGALLNSLGAVSANATATVDVTQGVSSLNGEADFRIGSTSSDGVHYFSKEGTGAKPTLTVVCATPTVPDNTPPSAPTNLSTSAANSGEVDLSWSASTDNIGVSSYDILRDGSKVGSVPGSSLTYQDTTVAASTSYSYAVVARDAAGNISPASNTATVTTPASAAPAAPSNLVATAVNGTTVNLTWTASTSSNVTGYNVYRGLHGGTLTLLSGGSAGTSPYTDATATAGTAYDYAVTAVATGGSESVRSNIATATTPGGGSSGIAPRSTTATVTPITSAATSWTVSLPAYSSGDFVVLFLGDNLGSTAGVPTSSGWTNFNTTNESSGLKGAFLGKRMTGTEGSSITVTWGAACLGVAEATAFTGVNTAAPVDVPAVGQAEASTTAVASHSTKSVTTVTANVVLVSGFTTDVASTWTQAGDTELADAAAGNVSASVYYSSPVPIGTYSKTATASVASVKAVSSLLALRPSG
jgi:fibronectin type 3 domain-containing protein